MTFIFRLSAIRVIPLSKPLPQKKQKNTPLFFSFPFCVFQTRTLFLWENYSFLADYRLNGTQEIMSNLRVENDFPIS